MSAPHASRHRNYSKARSLAEEAHGLTDDTLMRRLDIYNAHWGDPGWYLKRSLSRVKHRVYMQEALKRGLIAEDPKDIRY